MRCFLSARLLGLFVLFVLPVLAVGLLGCGGGSGATEISGKVTYNGKPLAVSGGKITFRGSDGKDVTAEIGTDGTYKASGVQVGENKVAVSYPNPKFQPGGGKGRVPQDKGVDKTGGPPEPPQLIPAEYGHPDTSKLTVKIEKNTVYNPELNGPEIK
jgi:hypothetical protein